MAKRGYKLQEFLAHSGNVNCLNIGKKACRLFVTGGDDHKVNVWAIGKPESLMSLNGHTSPVESVAFDSSEVLVLAGTSSGVIKQWDLEEAKMVRTLSGHRSNCTAVEFHPFGEFFASGSLDTNLRVWDIRKKGCLHTYKGHTQGISTIKFSPDGRWVVSGGLDNVVKVWDLTAGKLLHDFTFHEGHIRSLAFHPLEFLLATGSADRTVKFWDLETFELIGSTRPEATGVRAVTFHPDGRTLFSGLEESLKVYSWEPVIRHDAVDIGWSTLGDLCIHEGKLLGCSYYQNSVGVWVADISLIEPYGDASQNDHTEPKFNIKQQGGSERLGTVLMNSNIRCRSPDYDTKEIKNIYVDSSGGKPVSQKVEFMTPPKVPSYLETNEIKDQVTKKQSHIFGTPPRPNDIALNKSFIAPSIVPRDSPDEKDSSKSTAEPITFTRTKRGMLLRPAHVKKPSNNKNGIERLPRAVESGNIINSSDDPADPNSEIKNVSEDTKGERYEKTNSSIDSVAERLEKVLSPQTPNGEESEGRSPDTCKDSDPIKVVNGVTVVRGRTRSLVERFEKREQSETSEDQATVTPSHSNLEVDKTPTTISSRVAPEEDQLTTTISSRVVPVVEKLPAFVSSRVDQEKSKPNSVIPSRVIQAVDETPKTISGHVTRDVDKAPTIVLSRASMEFDKTPTIMSPEPEIISSRVAPEVDDISDIISSRVSPEISKTGSGFCSHVIPEVYKTPIVKSPEVHKTPIVKSPDVYKSPNVKSSEVTKTRTVMSSRRIPLDKTRAAMSSRVVREVDKRPTFISSRVIPEVDTTPSIQIEEPQVSTSDLTSINDTDVTEDLMQTHEVFLSSLRSRLTRLQVVRHFWERGDIKGAIGAMKKLPDQSVQADVISVLMDKMDILNLDLFSTLLPVLLGLLSSKTDRHATLSMEMLLKLVAVFGPVISSTVTARRGLGVDLHAEQRKECCNQCSLHLQQIKKILPSLARRGGLVAKSALELNLVLQES